MPDLKEIKRAGVSDEEVVARAIFSPSFFKRDGTIGPQAFFLTPLRGGRREKDISVLRESLCEDLVNSVRRIPPRNDRDKVSGYAELEVKAIRSLSYQRQTDEVVVDVLASPSVSQPAHASIIIKNHNRHYTSADNILRPLPPALMNIMSKLATISTYVPFTVQEATE